MCCINLHLKTLGTCLGAAPVVIFHLKYISTKLWNQVTFSSLSRWKILTLEIINTGWCLSATPSFSLLASDSKPRISHVSSCQQRLVQRVLVLTLKFEIPQQPIRIWKSLPKSKTTTFFHLYSMQLFIADVKIFKNSFNLFFAHENMKKPPTKDAHNRP